MNHSFLCTPTKPFPDCAHLVLISLGRPRGSQREWEREGCAWFIFVWTVPSWYMMPWLVQKKRLVNESSLWMLGKTLNLTYKLPEIGRRIPTHSQQWHWLLAGKASPLQSQVAAELARFATVPSLSFKKCLIWDPFHVLSFQGLMYVIHLDLP